MRSFATRCTTSLLLALVMASSAHAMAAPGGSRIQPDGSVPLAARARVGDRDAERQARLDESPAWRGFRARHGEWKALWNEASGSPHRAFGRGIPLPGFANDPAAVDRAVRAFIVGNPEVFGPAPVLSLVASERAGRVWYVRYRPMVNGVPVLLSDWEFRVGVNGKLFAFGADVERANTSVSTQPAIVPAVAREAAKQGLAFDPAIDRVEGADALYLLPRPAEQGEVYALVYRVGVRTANPPGNWIAYVDALDGAVLWRHDRVRYDVGGTVSGLIHPNQVADVPASRPFGDLWTTVGSDSVVTDSLGHFTIATATNPVTVSAAIRGRYCDVNRDDGAAEASFSVLATNPSTVDIAWTDANSHEAERDGYYHVNVAHRYAKRLEPSFTGLDYEVPCLVNIASTCNAFWDGLGVNFFAAGGGCPNTATIPDVVYHEYGHGVNDYVYIAHGSLDGMVNGALHEGMADVNAAFLRDDPRIGVDFGGPGTLLRDVDNTAHWPEDASADPHATGQIVAGAFWDLRQAVGLAVAEHLAHFAKHGIPDDLDDGVAMSEFFTETLVADDDDADLSNGTPHSSAIIAAFNAHGIGTGFSLRITHTPLADRPAGGSVPVTATIRYTGAIGSLDSGSPTLHYSVNRAAFSTLPMTPTGNPDEFGATLSAPDTSVIQYYLSASDSYGQSITQPATAPIDLLTFVVGSPATALFYDMETAAGWTGTAAGDNAATGRWVRANPVGTRVDVIQVQPEDDHTPTPGLICWVTGNGQPGGDPGIADVDAGRTTLLSPVFDASTAVMTHPLLEFYRWYTNNAGGAPGSDFWKVDLSNNGGGTWTSVENTTATDNSWRRVVFRIEDYLPPTSTMRVRFIASDEGSGSLVEAGVDDFRLMAFPGALTAVDDVARPLALGLAAPAPNPFRSRTVLRFSLPARGHARLRLFDLNGRWVRTAFDGDLDAGAHDVAWDGRDASGVALPSGAYFARLEHGGHEVVRRIVRLR